MVLSFLSRPQPINFVFHFTSHCYFMAKNVIENVITSSHIKSTHFSHIKKIEVYKEVLYTITHKIGTGRGRQGGGGGHSAASTGLHPSPSKSSQQLPLLLKDELYSYARNAFGFTMEEHRRLLSLTTEQKVQNF